MSAADLQTAALSFSVELQSFGRVEERALGGHEADDPVTLGNREEYVQLYLSWALQDSVEPQFKVGTADTVKR